MRKIKVWVSSVLNRKKITSKLNNLKKIWKNHYYFRIPWKKYDGKCIQTLKIDRQSNRKEMNECFQFFFTFEINKKKRNWLKWSQPPPGWYARLRSHGWPAVCRRQPAPRAPSLCGAVAGAPVGAQKARTTCARHTSEAAARRRPFGGGTPTSGGGGG